MTNRESGTLETGVDLTSAQRDDERDKDGEWKESTPERSSSEQESFDDSDDDILRYERSHQGIKRRRGQRGRGRARGRGSGRGRSRGRGRGRGRGAASSRPLDEGADKSRTYSKEGPIETKMTIDVEEFSYFYDDGIVTPPLPASHAQGDVTEALDIAQTNEMNKQEEIDAHEQVNERERKEKRLEERRRRREQQEQEEEAELMRQEQIWREQLMRSEEENGDLDEEDNVSLCSDDDDYYERRRQEQVKRNAKMLAFLMGEDVSHSVPSENRNLAPTSQRALFPGKNEGKAHTLRTFEDGTTISNPPPGQTFELAYIALPELRERSRSSYMRWDGALSAPDIIARDEIVKRKGRGERKGSPTLSDAASQLSLPGTSVRSYRRGPAGDGLDGEGTSCHQCRRKTLDEKMRCRNHEDGKVCSLFFCQRCLDKRYGIAGEAWDPESRTWVCPRCRAECNCSLCLLRSGKGDLIRPKHYRELFDVNGQQRYRSFKDYLDSMSPDGVMKIGSGGIGGGGVERNKTGGPKKVHKDTQQSTEGTVAIREEPQKRRGRPKKLNDAQNKERDSATSVREPTSQIAVTPKKRGPPKKVRDTQSEPKKDVESVTSLELGERMIVSDEHSTKQPKKLPRLIVTYKKRDTTADEIPSHSSSDSIPLLRKGGTMPPETHEDTERLSDASSSDLTDLSSEDDGDDESNSEGSDDDDGIPVETHMPALTMDNVASTRTTAISSPWRFAPQPMMPGDAYDESSRSDASTARLDALWPSASSLPHPYVGEPIASFEQPGNEHDGVYLEHGHEPSAAVMTQQALEHLNSVGLF